METTNQRFGLQPQSILSCHSYFGVALCRVRALGGVVKALCEPRTSVGAGKPSGKRRTSAITEQVSVHHVTHAMASFATWLEDNPPMRRVSHLALQAYHDSRLTAQRNSKEHVCLRTCSRMQSTYLVCAFNAHQDYAGTTRRQHMAHQLACTLHKRVET